MATPTPIIPHIFVSRTEDHTDSPESIAHRRRATCLALGIFAVIVVLLFIAFDQFKGYHVECVSPGYYVITVDFDRDDATTALRYMDRSLQDACLLRDVRLPDGTLVPTYLSRIDAADLLATDADRSTAITTCDLADYDTVIIDEERGIVTQYVRITYREIATALASTTPSEPAGYLVHGSVPLPSGRPGTCWLSADTLDEYRRRLHTIGATGVYLPFTWYLDSTITASLPDYYLP